MVSFKKSKIDKVFEKFPALLTLVVILFPVIGSFFIPREVAIFILVFNVFFFYKSLSFTIQFIISGLILRGASQINWDAKLEGLENIDSEIEELELAKKKVKKKN